MNRTTPRRSLTRLAVLSALTLLAACGSDAAPAATRSSIATAPAADLTVELLADGPLGTGLNAIYLKVTDAAGSPVTDATVSFVPLMTMPGPPVMTHRCPVMGAPTVGADGLYRTSVVFQMASGMMGTWSAVVGVTRPGGALKEASFASLAVADTGHARTFVNSMVKYVVSLDYPTAPAVGLNPVVVTLHSTMDMGMSFMPVSDATIVAVPWMTSMSHGSTGNVNPALVSNGRYQGTLAFSMAGTWDITLTLTRPLVDPLASVVFTTTF
jgi:hypothetical protein